MNTHKFKIGDPVIWKSPTKKSFRGIIREIKDRRYQTAYVIEFEPSFAKEYSLSSNFYERTTEITFDGPPKTKTELVEDKCKYLWNKSKYIKNNPTLAY